MSSIEPAPCRRIDQDGSGTVMQCTEGSDDLECYYKRLLYASNDSKDKMFPSSTPPTQQTSDANHTLEALPGEWKVLGKEGTKSHPKVQHRQVLSSREECGCHGRMDTCTTSSEFLRHNRMSISSVLPTSSKEFSSSHHLFRRNTGYQEQGFNNTFEESFEHKNDNEKEYKHLHGQVATSVKCGAPTALDPTIPNIPLPRASKASPCSHSDSYEEDYSQSAQAKQQFEVDNLFLQSPKKENSLSSSSSSDSNLEACLPQNHPMFSNTTSEQDHFYCSKPKMQSYLSGYSSDESNLEDSKSSYDSYKVSCNFSKSAVFSCGDMGHISTIQNSGTHGGLHEERSYCKPNADDELQHPVRVTRHSQSAKPLSSGHLNSALTERSMDSQSVHCSSWQRNKCYPFSNNQQVNDRKCSPVTQAESLGEVSDICNGESTNFDYRTDRKESYPDKVHIIKEPHPDTATSHHVIEPEAIPDIIESLSSHSVSSGDDNGTSEEELRGRCIAPACFSEIMHTKSSLCIGCYHFLQTANGSYSEYHTSLFAVDKRLCKGPNCRSPGSVSLKGLCQSCFHKLSGFVGSKSDKKVTGTVSDPLQVRPHSRREPNMSWGTYYKTPLKKM